MAVTLQNSTTTPSLYQPVSSAGGWFAYLLPPGVTDAATFTLDTTWTAGTPAGNGPPGYYLFCAQAPQNLVAFVQNLYQYLQSGGNTGVKGLYPYFLWIHTPDSSNLNVDVMKVASGYPYPVVSGGGANINLGTNYFLFVNSGGNVVANWTATPPVINFSGNGSSNRFTANGLLINSLSGQMSLPMDGALRGCLQAVLTLSTQQQFAAMDVGLRYYIAGQAAASLQSLAYPVFNWTNIGSLGFAASLNPVAPTDPTTCNLGFPKGTLLPSYFNTALGQAPSLTALGTGGLAFQPYPTTAPPSNGLMALTMTPSGDFSVSVPANPASNPLLASQSVMCGLAGTEYIGPITPQNALSPTLNFTPGQAAYAPNYPPPAQGTQGASPQTASVSLLTSLATTAWVSMSPPTGGSIDYFAQPNKGELYHSPTTDILGFLEVVAEPLGAASSLFPMAPYSGVTLGSGLTLTDYSALELQILSPCRRQRITPDATARAQSSAFTDTDPVTGATPQGLLATIQGPTWTDLVLAQDANGTLLQFYDKGSPLPTELTGALQTNQQFLVISDPTLITDFLMTTSTVPPNQNPPSDSIDLSGWKFIIDPKQWNTHNTIMVFKFRHGTLQQFASDTSIWTQAGTFNVDPDSVSSALGGIIDDAVASKDPNFQFFATQIATNPDWNGILFFNCTVPLASLPPEVAGLAGGIDASKFDAHHLGIQITPLKSLQGQLSQQQSSLFGLIDYTNAAYPPEDGSGYNFNVLNLKVLFENSVIKSFASQIEVSLNKLFGEKVTQLNSASNSIVLNGSYQNQNGKQSYVFGESGDNVFQFPQSKVLNSVEILKAQFTTSIPSAGLTDGDPVQTRFSFWGNLNFQALPGFDVFSFGTDPAQQSADPYFLRFGNLGLDMDFTFSTGALSSRTFTFDPNQMSFDIATSQPRPGSLYSHFPLKLTGLISATANQLPSDLGYMQIDSPLASSSLTYPWYGLTFELNLGSVGALAGKVGMVAGLIAAWCPSTNNYNVLIGLKLPGSSGSSKAISIEGVVKLTFQDLEFIVTGDTYILKLANIALKLLSLSLPPNGQTAILLFGDPSQADNTTLGWYAAYAQKPTPPPSKGQTQALGTKRPDSLPPSPVSAKDRETLPFGSIENIQRS